MKNKTSVWVVIMIMLLSLFILPVENVGSAWWNGDWSYYKTITIDNAYIDATLTNFPILVSIDDATGDKCKAAGEDVRFLLPDNSTVLNHEIEKWVDNDERLVWVNVTTIASDVDTVFLMYYGNAGAADNQNPTGVWDSNFKAVYHLDELLGDAIDSTINNNDGTYVGNLPNRAASKIGYGQDFDGNNNDWIVLPVGAYLTTIGTVEMWTESDNPGGYRAIWHSYSLADNTIINFRYDGSMNVYSQATSEGAGQWALDVVGTGTNWHYASIAWQTNDAYLVRDNVVFATDNVCIIQPFSPESSRIGCTEHGLSSFDGVIDEVRISDIRRSNIWLGVSFHSQNQTTGFLTFGSEQALPNNPPTQSGEVPVNRSTGISLTPSLHVICTDADSDTMTATWRSNSSSAWVDFATNTSISTGTNITQTNSNFSAYSTTYYWSVNLTDGKDWTNATYHFTTASDSSPPVITSESITSGLTSGENATLRANVTDASNIEAVWVIVNDTDGVSTNYTMSQEGATDFYNASFEVCENGTWYYKVFANDSHGNLNDTASWHSFIVSKPDATPDNEAYPTSASPLTLIRITAELDATDLLKSVNATLNVPPGFSFTDIDICTQNQSMGNFSAFETKTAEWHVFTPIVESIYTFNVTWTDIYENVWSGSDKNIEVSYDITNLSNSTFVNVICAVEIEAGNDFTAEIIIRDGLGNYVNADLTPEISLIDPLGDVSVGPTTAGVVNLETGRYSYTKSTAASWMGGSWQIFADVTRNGYSFTDREFFKITSGPFDVRSISIIDDVVSTLIISVILENQGGATKDMYVEWELTRIDTDGLLDSGSDTVAVAGSSTLTHIVFPFTSYVGEVKITFVGWHGHDFTEQAGAFETFTTVSEEGAPGGVIPGAPSTYTLTIICEDSSGNTISGVLLQISEEGQGLGSKYTDRNGEAFFEIPKYTTITISASKTGYESVEGTITADDDVTVTLYMNATGISLMLWLLLIVAILIIVSYVAYKKYNNKKR